MKKSNEKEKSHIGETIKKYRVLRNMRQKDLSIKTGITQNNISRYENGKVNPSIGSVLKIAEALDIPINEIMDKAMPVEFQKTMKETSIKLNEAAKRQFNKAKVAILEERKIKLQNQINESLEQKDLNRDLIRNHMEKISSLEKELYDLKIEIIKEPDNQEIDEDTIIDNSMASRFLDIGIFAELLEHLFGDGGIALAAYEENIFLSSTLKRAVEVGLDNLQILFPEEEIDFWIDGFRIIEAIKSYLDDSDESTTTKDHLINSITQFYSHDLIGVDPEMIKERFSRL